MIRATCVLSLLALTSAVDVAAAQCALASEWTEGFEIPGADGPIWDTAVFDAGGGPKLYMSGEFEALGGFSGHALGAWDGSAWSSLALDLTSISNQARYMFALEIFDDGGGPQLYAAGRFQSLNGLSVGNIARWDGAGWSALGNPGDTILDLAVFDDGSGPALYAGGSIPGGIKRWDGSTGWSTVGGGLSGTSRAVTGPASSSR